MKAASAVAVGAVSSRAGSRWSRVLSLAGRCADTPSVFERTRRFRRYHLPHGGPRAVPAISSPGACRTSHQCPTTTQPQPVGEAECALFADSPRRYPVAWPARVHLRSVISVALPNQGSPEQCPGITRSQITGFAPGCSPQSAPKLPPSRHAARASASAVRSKAVGVAQCRTFAAAQPLKHTHLRAGDRPAYHNELISGWKFAGYIRPVSAFRRLM